MDDPEHEFTSRYGFLIIIFLRGNDAYPYRILLLEIS
jgi:hypothetical protein